MSIRLVPLFSRRVFLTLKNPAVVSECQGGRSKLMNGCSPQATSPLQNGLENSSPSPSPSPSPPSRNLSAMAAEAGGDVTEKGQNTEGDKNVQVSKGQERTPGRQGTRGGVMPWMGGRGIGGGLMPLSTFSSLWDPYSGPRSLREMMASMDRLFDELTPSGLFRDFSVDRPDAFSPARTPWAVRETKDAYEIRVDMPGLTKEDINVQIEEGDTLVIKGKKEVEEGKEDDWFSSRAVYHTRLELPEDGKFGECSGEFKNGVLLLKVPKKVKDQSEVVSVPVQ